MVELEKLIIGNGAGSVKSMHDVKAASKSAATRITVGSVTLLKRAGNIGETYYYHQVHLWSMNSLGLPNRGMDEYERTLPKMIACAHECGKELCLSVAGFSPEEYAQLTVRAFNAGVDGVELNLSCPNVWNKSGHKAIPASDPSILIRIYDAVAEALPSEHIGKRISAKASPTNTLKKMQEFADTTTKSGIITEVIGFNAEGGKLNTRQDGRAALSFRADEKDRAIKHEGGFAGSGLTSVTPKRISMLRTMLPASIPVIALGGIFNGRNAYDNLVAGASGFMCTTSYLEYGPGIFSTIVQNLADLMPQAA